MASRKQGLLIMHIWMGGLCDLKARTDVDGSMYLYLQEKENNKEWKIHTQSYSRDCESLHFRSTHIAPFIWPSQYNKTWSNKWLSQ